MAIEREVDDAQSIRDAGVVKDKSKESQPSSFGSRKKHKTFTPQGFRDRVAAIKAKAKVDHL